MSNVSARFIMILCIIVMIIIILANIELYINERRSIISLRLSKNYNTLLPEYTGLYDPIYIYNPKKIKRADLPYRTGYDKNNYIKKDIDEHIASKLSHPLNDFATVLKQIPRSNSPINTLYNTIGKGGMIIGVADPLSPGGLRNYKMLTSRRDNVEAFIAHNKIYVMRK